MQPSTPHVALLMVCLGNICRSPLARWVVRDLAARRDLAPRVTIDSCGTGAWHAGGPADPRSVQIALRYGHDTAHVARQFQCADDADRFHLLLAMDSSNARTMIERGAPRHKVRLFRSFDPSAVQADDLEVPDPYYGGDEGFQRVYDMITRAGEGLLDAIQRGEIPAR